MHLQPTLSNEFVTIRPLQKKDFEGLYTVASDKSLWEQHPNSDRYKKEVFEVFFHKAIESKGAFTIIDNVTGEIIGSSRYYDLDVEKSSVVIGFTFIGKKYWGTNYNHAIKKLMLCYAFQEINSVYFHVGKTNFRSQKAMEKLGGHVVRFTTSDKGIEGNPVYEIKKEYWHT